MRGTVRAIRAIDTTPSDDDELPGYPIGFRMGGTDGTEGGSVTIAWKTAGGGSDVTCLMHCPVGETVPIEGFYKVLNTGTTLPTTDGQIVVYYGSLQRA